MIYPKSLQEVNSLPLNEAAGKWLKEITQGAGTIQCVLSLMWWMLEQNNRIVADNGMDPEFLDQLILKLSETKDQQKVYQFLVSPDAPSQEDCQAWEPELVKQVSEADSPEEAALVLLQNLSEVL